MKRGVSLILVLRTCWYIKNPSWLVGVMYQHCWGSASAGIKRNRCTSANWRSLASSKLFLWVFWRGSAMSTAVRLWATCRCIRYAYKRTRNFDYSRVRAWLKQHNVLRSPIRHRKLWEISALLLFCPVCTAWASSACVDSEQDSLRRIFFVCCTTIFARLQVLSGGHHVSTAVTGHAPDFTYQY